MDIKSKNKYLHRIALITAVYLFGLSIMLSLDIITHTEYLGSKSYFSSNSFKNDLSSLFYNIRSYHMDYRNYLAKSDYDKIGGDELQAIKNRYDPELSKKEAEIETMYKTYIDAAGKLGDKDKVNLLIEERDKKLEDLRKDYTIKVDADVKKVVELRDKDSSNLGKSLSQSKDLKYYIKNARTGEIYSNLSGISNIEDYIKNNALFSIQFPNDDSRNSYFSSINTDFISYDLTGYFIIPQEIEGYSQIQANIKYYNSIGTRISYEVLILIISVFILCFLGFYLKKNPKLYVEPLEKTLRLLRKMPLDFRLFALLIFTLIPFVFGLNISFFYFPITPNHLFKLSIITVFNLYLLLNLIDIIGLIRNKDMTISQLRQSISYKIYSIIKESFSKKNLISKVILLTALTLLWFISFVFTFKTGSDLILIITVPYTFIYPIALLIYLLKKLLFLNKIIEGSEQIVSGNFNHTIDVKDKGNLSKLAHNINNLQSSFKNSLESQMKSEKMKSELITNVSHDLKTPLTSIINYVDLLKREDLPPEKIKDYIGVLDKKTQRLKVLIEDLFEASKVTSGAVELNIEQVDIASLLHQALGEFDEKIKASSLTFKVNAPKQKIYANLDGKKTWRVFENLINNALKYSQPDTRVYIDLVDHEHSVILTVKNISSYEMDFDVEEIFERFKRGDKSRSTEGSGLGLAIAKSIIELQGGKLNIEIDGDLFKAIVEFFK